MGVKTEGELIVHATQNLTPVIALSDLPRQGRDADRFARGIRAYADLLRTNGIIIVSTHWNRSNDSPSVIIEVDDRRNASEARSLSERAASLLQRAGVSIELGHSWPPESAIWHTIQAAHEGVSLPLLHVSVPARFGHDLMVVTARALEPLRREAILLVGFSAVFGEAIRRDSSPTIDRHFGVPTIDIISGVPL
jgi:aromatic ring-opening dioxygenase catalytic subunit (LigB family)